MKFCYLIWSIHNYELNSPYMFSELCKNHLSSEAIWKVIIAPALKLPFQILPRYGYVFE